MASASEATPLSPDWVLSITSDAHCCADMGWFSEYTPFPSEVTNYFDTKVQVIGIGTVELPVKKSPKKSGNNSHGTLRLTDVLHIPDAEVNIIGQPIVKQYPYTTFNYGKVKHQGAIRDMRGRQIAYMSLNSHNLLALRLSGPPMGPKVGRSKLEPNSDYAFHISWPDGERRRWAAFQASNTSCGSQDAPTRSSVHIATYPGLGDPSPTPFEDYSPVKMQWLKTHHHDEHEFLVNYGLNIFKDEYREKGHALLSALMGIEDEQHSNRDGNRHNDEEEECSDDESDGDYEEYLRLEGRDVEQRFSDAELDFLEARFGSAAEFMVMHGLNADNDDDCGRAARVIHILMSKQR
ncbi:hypothetical protein F4776DRAFT_619328 [Hypoxylon sp. NC0597]|nr:hypothetical protein F4776DRAFT_619328 [Hypoxylon sp. NC0597]